ncbi:Imm41 family immunity protein [Burkholderia sp. BCC1977]|uniref:Imm41 family immunity protein n=1 Tax=Burkholderia sp. BCC1977 TaxID=2817440 RepID=UPI002ABE641D|nr:Imm41 family immunity protein [Burkholderia sp. BCC1977]
MQTIKYGASRSVIERNWVRSREYDELSFIAMLHEQGIWQKDQYWLVERALYDLTGAQSDGDNLSGPIFYIFSYAMNSISSHLDQGDSFEIKNLTRGEVYEFRERIRLVFEGFFLNNFPDQSMFEEENPLFSKGDSSL